jgi:hypothetical protein
MSEIKVGIQITADSQDAALLELISKAKMVQAELKNTESTADTTTRGLSTLSEGIKKLALQVGALMGLREAFNFFKEGIMDSMQEASMLQQTAANMKSLTGATDAQVGSLDGYTTAVQMASGVSQAQLYPALTKLGAATKDFSLSQTLLEVATGAAARGVGTFEGNVDGLIKVIEGKAAKGTDAFTTALRGLVLEGRLNVAELANLIQKYGDAGAAVDTEAMKLQRAKVAWGESKEAMGGAASTILTYLQPAMKIAAVGIGLVGGGVLKLIGYLQAGGQAFMGFGAAATMASWGNFKGAADILTENGEKVKGILEKTSLAVDEMVTNVLTAWDKAPEKANKSKKQLADEAASLQALINASKARGAENKDQSMADTARAFKTLRDAEVDEAKAAMDSAAGKKATYAAAAQLVSALDRQKQAEVDLVKIEQKGKVDAAKGDAAQILRINQETELKLEAINKKYAGSEEKVWKDAQKKQEAIGDKVTAAAKKDEAERDRIAKEGADKREETEKKLQDKLTQARNRRLAAERSLYGNMMSLASQYGGDSVQKAVQVIQTIEQLYEVWKAIEEIFFASKEVTEATAALTSMTTTKVSDVSQGTMNANLWAINAAASVAAIPYVGWAMAPGIYAESLALGLASVAAISAVPVAAGGALTSDAMLALIGEKGPELVIPTKFTRMFSGMADDYERASVTHTRDDHSVTRGGDVYMHVYNPIGATTDNAYRKIERKMRPARRANDKALANRPVTRVGSRGRIR